MGNYGRNIVPEEFEDAVNRRRDAEYYLALLIHEVRGELEWDELGRQSRKQYLKDARFILTELVEETAVNIEQEGDVE